MRSGSERYRPITYQHRTMRILRGLPLLIVSILLAGCFTTGSFTSVHTTTVELSEPNFELVATGVTGEATAGYLLGVSGGMFFSTNTVALARVSGSGLLYEEALADLWANFEEEYGEVQGRDLALVNVRYDVEALNLIVYTSPTVLVRADVVEFTD